MLRIPVASVFALLMAACASAHVVATPAFWHQWQSIRPGLSAAEVHARLGTPFTSYTPTDSDGRMEYWLFTKTDFTVVPPAESFQVLFDRQGRVEWVQGPALSPR